MRFILLIAIAVAGWLIYKLYFQKLQAQGKPGMIKIALIVVGLLFMAMAVTGRAHILFAIIGAGMTQIMRILPLMVRFFPMLQQFMNAQRVASPSSGNQSKVRTKSLVMSLDHDSGGIDGEVVSGTFAGRTLGSLSQPELQQLYLECQASDPEALRLLEAYVSRVHGENWQPGGNSDQHSAGGITNGGAVPTPAEALEILGLQEGADKATIVDAHRRLMSKMHPDKGGSNYLAAKINAAKEVLIDRIG